MKASIRSVSLAIMLVAGLGLAASPALADRANAHYRQGMALQNQGKIDEAIKAFEAAVAERPNHVMAWSSLGKLYKKKKNYPKSVSAYEKATSLNKNSATLWANLGYAYYRNKQVNEAISALERSLKRDNKNAEVHSFLGVLERKRKNIKAAIRHLEQAAKLKPKDAEFQNNLGVAYRANKQLKEAKAAFKRAIRLGAKALYHFNLGVVYRREDMIDEAIEQYTAAVKIDPMLAPAWYDLGIMHKANHDQEKAVQAFEKYLSLTQGKNAKEDKQVMETIESLGGTPVKKRKNKRRRKR